MKKFLTVLAIALIAMTAVFATEYNGDNLKLKLNIAAETKIGFTKEEVKSIDADLVAMAFTNNELDVANSQTVWASCITKSNSLVTIAVEVTDLTSGTNTIGVNFTNGTKNISFTEAENSATTKRVISVDASIVVDDYSNSVAGSYTGTMTLKVTAD